MFKAINGLVNRPVRPGVKGGGLSPLSRLPASAFSSGGGLPGGIALIDPSNPAFKSMGSVGAFSRSAMEFINSASGNTSSPYSEDQLLGACLTSVYLYAALRRVSNLISRVKVVGEVQQEGRWVRLPETHMLNQLFTRDGAETLSRVWLNHAVYGVSAIYKVKTRRAILEEEAGRPIYDFADGAVAGLYVLDKPLWDIDEDMSYGAVKGFYVNQYSTDDNVLGNRSYLQRDDVVYITDWNPQNPNRGKSMVSVCIHEAVANASIAQWISEYFTRGAMPFILVSMAEDDPAMMTDSDLRKYKRQFEEYWQGLSSSLRSVFFDRQVKVEQVGISADEVAAPELNETALEGIAATIGLDRELIVTPSGGSQERHALLVKRAWEDTVIPLAEKYVSAFNRDLGLPSNMRLVVDVSGIAELEADRENKADTEISIYESQLQSYNETRTRLKMAPIEELDGWYHSDGKLVPLAHIISAGAIPQSTIVDYATNLWDSNLARRSEVLELLGRPFPKGAMDGYKYEIEERVDLITSLWSEDLLTRSSVLSYLGFPSEGVGGTTDGYRSELERGADYGEWITQLWGDNLLTRSQVLGLLDMGLELPDGAPDGYSDEIGDRKSAIMDMWGDNLLTRSQTLTNLGYTPPNKMIDGFVDEIDMKLEMVREAEDVYIERIMDYWGDNLLTRSQVLDMLRLPKPNDMIDGYVDEVDLKLDAHFEGEADRIDHVMDYWGDNLITRRVAMEMLGLPIPDQMFDGFVDEVDEQVQDFYDSRGNKVGLIMDYWGDQLVTRSQALEMLGIPMPDGAIDGYESEVGNIADAISDKIGEMEAEAIAHHYNPEGDESVRALRSPSIKLPDDDPDDDPDGGGGMPAPEIIPPTSFIGRGESVQDIIDSEDDWREIAVSTLDPVDNLLYEIEQYPDEDATAAAEEDMLEGYGQYPHDVLVTPHTSNDLVDYLPGEALPHLDDDNEFYGLDADDSDDSWLWDDEIEMRGGDYYGDGDYYDNIAAAFDPEVTTDEDEDDADMDYGYDDHNEFDADTIRDILRQSEFVGDENIGSNVDAPYGIPSLNTPILEAIDDFDLPVVGDNSTDEPAEKDIANALHNAQQNDAADDGAKDLYVSLWIGHDERLDELQKELARRLGDGSGVIWQDPETFHITLVYAPHATDGDLTNVMSVLPNELPPLTLRVTGLSTFENDSVCIKLDVDGSDELLYLQSKLATAFNAYGISLSPYSYPDKYQPHITLGYAPLGTDIPDIDVNFYIRSVTVSLGRDGYEMVDEIPTNEIMTLLQGGDYDEPDGSVTDFLTSMEMSESKQQWLEMVRNNWCARLQRWHSDAESATLPEHILRAVSDYVMMDKFTDKVLGLTLDAIRAGAFDDEQWEVNPIKDTLRNLRAEQSNAHDELEAWQRATIRSGLRKGLRFETKHIQDEIADTVRSGLGSVTDGDVKSIKEIFDSARTLITGDE